MTPDLTSALAILRRDISGLVGVYLFGSQADGGARPDSDVDIAVFAGRPVAAAVVDESRHRLAEALRNEVDLIDLAAAPTILQAQVVQEGRLIDCADANAIGLFELRVLHDYRDLKTRRGAIEADIARRGRVHA